MNSFDYAICSPDDVDAVVPVLAEAFSRREPLGQAMGITLLEFERFVRLLAPKVASEQLTIVARDADTGKIVGVMLNEDSATPAPEGLETLGPKFPPIWDFLHDLEIEHRADAQTPQPGEWLHLFLLAVAPEAGSRGVAQGMVAASIDNAARRRYTKAVTEATGPISQRVFRKLGFTDRVRRPYADHPIFHPVAHAGATILMDRPLASN